MILDKKAVIFIVNPRAGFTIKNKKFIELVAGTILPASQFRTKVVFTERAGHAAQLAEEALRDGFQMVVALGGDGTVNEVANVMAGSDVPLGILPAGSGNGLARCLGISMNFSKALRTLVAGKTRLIDTVSVNGRLYTSIAGVGFDAHVAQIFSTSVLRGMFSYLRIVLREFRRYEPKQYRLSVDGKPLEAKALMIVFANGNQFGYNTLIAPKSKIDDGLIDVCVFRKMPVSQMLNVGLAMITGKVFQTGYAEYVRAKEIVIHNDQAIMMNIDGEPLSFPPSVQIAVRPLSLRVVVP